VYKSVTVGTQPWMMKIILVFPLVRYRRRRILDYYIIYLFVKIIQFCSVIGLVYIRFVAYDIFRIYR